MAHTAFRAAGQARLAAQLSSDSTDAPFTVFYSAAALNIGEGHEIRDDPSAVTSREPQRVIDACGDLASVGVTDTWIAPPPVDGLEAYLDHMSWVAESIMPLVA